ncbi:MAG: hypothetical protein ACRDY7_19020 [Acidimicrobiia bacterium]
MSDNQYRQLLETNEFIRKQSDITYWLCITRSVQESKLFPVNPYILLSYLNAFYRWPTLLRRVEEHITAEECGDRAREASLKLDTINSGWALSNFYLLGRELLLTMGVIRPQDAYEDVVYVVDFARRFNLAFQRNNGHLTNKDAGDRGQLLPERTLQVFEADVFDVEPGDRLHTASTQLMAQLSQYAFLAHCECRVGIHNSGPYAFGDGRQMIVRDWFDLTEGDYPWLDGIAGALEYNNLTIPVVVKDTNFHLMDDWASFESTPGYAAENVAAVGLYTSDALSDGYQPVSMESPDRLAATMEHVREVLSEATVDLWKRIADWSRAQMVEAGALVYSSVPKDFAHLAGIYDPVDWFTLDDRARRFVPLLNDEYGNMALGEMVGLLSYPQQRANEYVMARTSNEAKHMISPLPYSILVDDDAAPTVGGMGPGSTALPPKTGRYTTSRGRLTLEEYNRASAGFRPAAVTEPYRFLDDEWVKYHWDSDRAGDLYRRAQQSSRTLAGRGAGLRRSDIGALRHR